MTFNCRVEVQSVCDAYTTNLPKTKFSTWTTTDNMNQLTAFSET